MGEKILRRVLMITSEMFLMAHLRNTMIIVLLGSVWSIVDGLGDTL